MYRVKTAIPTTLQTRHMSVIDSFRPASALFVGVVRMGSMGVHRARPCFCSRSEMYQSNPERPMNAAALAWGRLIHGGPAMFPEQISIYRHLAQRCRGQKVLDVGCG